MEGCPFVPLRPRVKSMASWVSAKLDAMLNLPVFTSTELPEVLSCSGGIFRAMIEDSRQNTHFGTISLNNSILSLPAGVSPILTSMKTTGLVIDVISIIERQVQNSDTVPDLWKRDTEASWSDCSTKWTSKGWKHVTPQWVVTNVDSLLSASKCTKFLESNKGFFSTCKTIGLLDFLTIWSGSPGFAAQFRWKWMAGPRFSPLRSSNPNPMPHTTTTTMCFQIQVQVRNLGIGLWFCMQL